MDEKAAKTKPIAPVSSITALRRTAIFFGAALLIAVILRLVCYNGLIGFGDIGILEAVRNVNSGIWPDYTHPFLNKFGLLLPLALTFEIFGANEYAQMAVPFLASLGTIAVTFAVARRAFSTEGRREYGDVAGFLAAIIIAVNPLDVILATWIRWDAVFALAAAISVGFLFLAYREKRAVYLLLSALGTGWAYLTQNSGALLVLFGLGALIIFALSKRVPFYYPIIWLALTSLIVAGEYIGWYAIKGDALFAWRYALEPATPRFGEISDLISRLGMEFIGTAFWEIKGIGVTLAVGITASIVLLLRRQWEYLLLILWAILVLLWADFGSERFTAFVPAILTTKPLLPAIFPLSILISAAFTRIIIEPEAERALQRWTGAIVLPVFFALMAFSSGTGGFVILLIVYPLLLLFPVLFLGLARRIKSVETAFSANLGIMGVIAFTVVLLTVPTVYLKWNRVDWVGNERAIVEYCGDNAINRIYTDDTTKRTIDYINGYRDGIKLFDYDKRNESPQPGDIYAINRYKLCRTPFRKQPEPAFFHELDTWEQLYIIDDRSPEPAEIYRVR